MKKTFAASLVEGKRKNGIALIAEIKKASPSEGNLISNYAGPATRYPPQSAHKGTPIVGVPLRASPASFDCARQAQLYEAGGAHAISVLTETSLFNGSLEDLRFVSKNISIPTLRKDFITQTKQIDEAKQYGASAILLIVQIVDVRVLRELFVYATKRELEVLVETHTPDEVTKAISIGATIIGVNARNLATLKIDKTIFEDLLPLIPKHCIKIAESGIETRSDVGYALKNGADAVLIGSAIMKSNDPEKKIKELLV